MKNRQKALVALLVIALMISCFAFSSFAAAESDRSAVLEYYETDVYFNSTFDELENAESVSADEVFSGASDEFKIGNYDALSVSDGVLVVTTVEVANMGILFNGENAPASFGLNLGVVFPENDNLAICLHASDFSTTGSLPIPLLYKTSDGVRFMSGDDLVYGESLSDTLTDSAPVAVTAGEYYDIQVFCTAYEDGVEGKVSFAKRGETASEYTFAISNYDVSALSILYTNGENDSNTIKHDYIEFYEGSFVRRLNDNSSEIGALLKAIADDGEATAEDYEALRKVVIDYGYSTEGISDATEKSEVDVAIKNVLKALAAPDAEAFKAGVATIAEDAYLAKNYVEKNAHIDTFRRAADSISFLAEKGYSDVLTELEIDAASVEAYDAEIAALAEIEMKTLAGIEKVNSIADVNTANYDQLKIATDSLYAAPIEYSYRNAAMGIDDAYMAAVAAKELAIKTTFAAKLEMAAQFVANTLVAYSNINVPAEGADFSVGYNAYTAAKANKFAGIEDYPVADAQVVQTMPQLVEMYSRTDAIVIGIASEYNAIVLLLDKAVTEGSYSVKEEAIVAAKTMLDVIEPKYPGVSELLNVYTQLNNDLLAKKTLAANYISAVIAIDLTQDINTIKMQLAAAAAIANDGGNNVTVNAEVEGVTVEIANQRYDTADKYVKNYYTNAQNFVNATNAIATAVGIEARRAAIIEALELKALANQSADGVNQAIATLSAAVAAFNAEIDAANAAQKTANSKVADVLAQVAPTVNVAKVVAIVKKIYE